MIRELGGDRFCEETTRAILAGASRGEILDSLDVGALAKPRDGKQDDALERDSQ